MHDAAFCRAASHTRWRAIKTSPKTTSIENSDLYSILNVFTRNVQWVLVLRPDPVPAVPKLLYAVFFT